MKKRSILVTAISLVLVAALSIGGTMAYFTRTSDTKENKFTVGNINIELTEPGFVPADALKLVPGDSIAKDPQVKNTGANPCYLRIAVTGLDFVAASTNAAATLKAPTGFTLEGLDLTNYEIVNDNGKIYAYYKSILNPDVTTPKLFTAVSLNRDVEENDEGLVKQFNITVYAEAIQCEGNLAPAAGEDILVAAKRAFANFPSAG
ncbi:TasA family protein [Acetanaerobacterium elongatum]|uniref:Alternate signal-mediated exported protein, CPF_0494 family n=1 Tax=Acetanaerobacterium elongatum TaxID=258515 RepID=A0A1G9V1Z7_9FIRM|nr:TasA family protein [Acetanaerobacterium elongatum]SDM66244.1 alternate signal-mediated exported protein, CPF_0494 family [Acetanaerobacterium elongatum]